MERAVQAFKKCFSVIPAGYELCCCFSKSADEHLASLQGYNSCKTPRTPCSGSCYFQDHSLFLLPNTFFFSQGASYRGRTICKPYSLSRPILDSPTQPKAFRTCVHLFLSQGCRHIVIHHALSPDDMM